MFSQVLGLIFLACLSRSAISTKGTVRGKEPRVTPIGEKEARGIDMRLIAKAYNCSLAEAESHIVLQDEFKHLVSKLEEHESFADSAMALNPGDSVSIYFKERVPSEFEQDVEEFSGRNRVNVEKFVTKYSRKEQETRAHRIAGVLERRGYTHVGYALGPGDELEVVAAAPEQARRTRSSDLDPDTPPTTNEEMDKYVKTVLGKEVNDDDLQGVRLSIVPQGEPLDGDDHTRGGRAIWSSGSGGGCTTGFSVVAFNGWTGVATAAHCSGMNMYDAEPPEDDYSTNWAGQHYGYWGDVEWHTTPIHVDLPEFWASPSDLRDVTSVEYSFSRNDWICGYSRKGERGFCDQIRRTNVMVAFAYNLIEMQHDNMEPGDSGGPWYIGTKAAGIHKGYSTTFDWSCFCYKTRDVFTKAVNLPVALGVAVLTT